MKKLKIIGWIFASLITFFSAFFMLYTFPYTNVAADIIGYVVLGVIFSVSALIACIVPIVLGTVGIVKSAKMEESKEKTRTIIGFVLMMAIPLLVSFLYFGSLFVVDAISGSITIG